MKIPKDIIEVFERASEGLDYGKVTLKLFLKQGKPRYVIGIKTSIVPPEGEGNPTTILVKTQLTNLPKPEKHS
jgi:hypothetical protein